ncbi:putative calcium-transporting ATPase 4, plasma membrane-type [Hibiscus syriacus]|uniref:Calcium-transporting ATPase n=1 Tax=Hibiscus syriacus TaxID=106335 RepID=A0A6A2ZTT4_HIBSY|nr:putative calcium-transporting ATPase 4, plasma membrane-type [Hibiscus syriacus]
MEDYLRKNFAVEHKRPSEEALRRWRSAVALVKNRSRRFRMVADLAKRAEADRRRKVLQEKIRVAIYVQKAALNFIDAGKQVELPEDVRKAGFGIGADELASIVRTHDMKSFEDRGGVEGLAKKVSVSLTNGVVPTDISIRQNIFGYNKFAEKPAKSFWTFVWEALHDLTLIVLMVCAVVSIGAGIATEGWPSGLYDGLGIVLCIFLVVLVTAISDYKQSLQFRDLDKEKKNIFVQDQVPADGVLISGYSLSIDESSLSGESEPVNVTQQMPFLLAGTKVQDGSGKMLVTTVGMRTEWGRLMVTLSEGGVDETPLQVKLNGVATVIGKIGLVFAVLTFLVLMIRFIVEKANRGEIENWSGGDALTLLDFFAIAVTIIVVAVPEGLPLAVTLSLAFAMKKLMSDRALVRHLSACETMGSATSICTDKTGTLTTNHMVVNKIWTCGRTISIEEEDKMEVVLRSSIAGGVLDILWHSIFQNTGAEVVKGKDGRNNILGSPTETAILEFEKKKMSVLVSLSNDGGKRAFCKGASEIILESCSKVINVDGKAEPLSKEQHKSITDVINGFASEALRTLCLAFKDVKDTSNVDSNSIPQDNYTLIAVIGIKDPVRPGVRQAVETCLAAGITVRVVTGDNINTAKAIARECGILTDDGLAIEGPDFRDMSPRQMEEAIPKLQVLARSLPLDKHKLVTYLRKELNEVVAVTGDGTNDAPALHEADIGLAMGIAGTEVAKESADVIIMDDNFSTIQNVARWGRAVYINIQKFVQFQLTVNIVALMLNFISACISGSTPLTAVQLLWVNMIMDTLGALALATDPPHEGLMRRPPIGRDVAFLTRAMWRNIIGQTSYQLIVLAVLKFDGKRLLKLSGSDAAATLDTLVFNTFVFCQLRFLDHFTSAATSVGFQSIIVELLGTFAETVPLSWELWLTSVLIGAGSLIVAVILKCIPVEKCKEASPAKNHDGYEQLPSGPDMA